MKINELQTAIKLPLSIEASIMFSTKEMEIIHLCLEPNKEIPLHRNSFDVVACLISGEVTLLIENIEVPLKLYTTAFIKKNEQRGIKNTGITEARLLMIKQLYTQ